EHLLAALLNDAGIAGLISKAGGNANALKKTAADAIARLPVVEGEPGEVHMGRELANLLNVADKEAQKRGDQYIASELFLLAAAGDKGNVGRLLKQAGVTKAALRRRRTYQLSRVGRAAGGRRQATVLAWSWQDSPVRSRAW